MRAALAARSPSACGQRGPSQPGREGGVAEQQPAPGARIGAQLADVAEGAGGPVARLGDLRLGHRGLRPRVEVGELRAGRRTGGKVQGRGRDVAPTQFDHAEHAVRGRGVPVRAEGHGDIQGRLAIGGGLGKLALGELDPRAQQGQSRPGRDAVQRRLVGGVQDAAGLLELTQVDQGGGEREQRLDVAGIRGDPGSGPRRVAQQPERVADPAAVPAEDRAGEPGRRHGAAGVLAGGGQHGPGYLAGKLVAQPGERLQVRGQRLVPQVVRQLRACEYQLGLAGRVPGLAAGN